MPSTKHDLERFQKLLQEGSVQAAYWHLISYMQELRTQFQKSHGDRFVSGLYQGYMDFTYFALFPPALRDRKLKVPIVFNYDAFRFEVWLSGSNRGVQRRYWELIGAREWPDCRSVAQGTGVDSILERDLASGLELTKRDELTEKIRGGAERFIGEVEAFLEEHAGS